MRVEVFKTNVQQRRQALALLGILSAQFPGLKINFDLEDCDRILRVEGSRIPCDSIIEAIACNGYYCEVFVC